MKTLWQECENHPRGKAPWAFLYATLNPHGHLVLSRHAVEQLGSPERVKVLYDGYNNRLGLAATEEPAPKSFRLSKRGPAGGRVVHINTVLIKEDIQVPETIQFVDAKFEDNILVLDLRTARVSKRVKGNRWNREKEAG